jgi:hypothetical protein
VREPSRVTSTWGKKASNLRSWVLMKAIQPDCARSLVVLAAALSFGCSYRGEREIVHIDGEIFDAVVRSQAPDSSNPEPRTTSALRFDARPAGDNTDLAATPEHPRRLDLSEGADSLSAGALRSIINQRKDILRSAAVEEGGPFNYPDCGGTRTRRAPDSTAHLGAPRCPGFVRRYVTVGLPYRGAAPLLVKVRPPESPPADSAGEQWTVLVTESSVGPGGQQWRQYVTLFRREPESGRLAMAERFLLSWAE